LAKSPKKHAANIPKSTSNILTHLSNESTEAFDEWFQISSDKDQHKVVQQLKSDVTRDLQPKKNPN
jgi:hypothetical protein